MQAAAATSRPSRPVFAAGGAASISTPTRSPFPPFPPARVVPSLVGERRASSPALATGIATGTSTANVSAGSGSGSGVGGLLIASGELLV